MKNGIIKNCEICNTEFERLTGNQKMCSKKCRDKKKQNDYYNSGKHPRKFKEFSKHLKDNIKTKDPLPGDLIYVNQYDENGDKVKTLGVITGDIGVKKDTYTICMNPELPCLKHKDNTIGDNGTHSIEVVKNDLHFDRNLFMQFEETEVRGRNLFLLVKTFLVKV